MGANSTIRTIDTDKGEVSYDSDMPMRALEGIMGAANTGNLTALMEGLSEFVTAWPYDSDPAELESWRDLKRSEFNAVTTAVVQDIGDLGNE